MDICTTNDKSSRIAQEVKRKSIAFLRKTILRLELTSKSALWQHWGHLVKERGANKWASQTWQLGELQTTSNLTKVDCSTRNVPTYYMMHISPIPHHPSKSRSFTFANIRKQNQKASKGGVFEGFQLAKTNIRHMHAHFKGEIKPKVAHLHQG